jgi:hypothetical protein
MARRRVPSVLLVVVLAGCTSHGTSAANNQPSPIAPSRTAPALTDDQLVASLVIPAAGLGAGTTSAPLPGGDQVAGEVTLDVCGGKFPSEALRTARRQVQYAVRGKPAASQEVVTYRTGGVAQAMREVGHAIATCPHHPVASPVAGVPPLTYTLTRLPHRAPWPATTQAYRVQATDGHQVQVSIGIFMWNGHVFTGIYGPADASGGPSPTVLTLAAAAATTLATVA